MAYLSQSQPHRQKKINETNILADIWCILSGGSLVYGSVNGCQWGVGGWLGFLSDMLGAIWGAISGGGDGAYSGPGVVYAGSYAPYGSSSNYGGSYGGSGGYQGEAIWVSTSSQYCPINPPNEESIKIQQVDNGGSGNGCTWTKYPISFANLNVDTDTTPIDYNNIAEVDPSQESFSSSDEPDVLQSDGITYNEYQQTDNWPTVLSVIPALSFVKYNNDPTACLRLAKQQIGLLGYKVSGYDLSNGMIFQTYSELKNPHVNLSQTKQAVTYINQALIQGIPILVGIDDAPGSQGRNADGTTDHFVVIVGAGTDSNGKYYRFFDNGTNQPARGTSRSNKLYYDESSGLISGHTQVGSLAPYTYIISQVRRSIKI